MSDNAQTKLYYNNSRVSPAPQVSFNTELVYANDSVAGYSYIITLNGYATAIDYLSDQTNVYGLKAVSDKIEHTRNIFSINGKDLLIKDKDNNPILEARGGYVRSISFNDSSNNWVNYAPYQIEIEFSEIIINGCSVSSSISCAIPSVNGAALSPNLIDITKYKIKSFNDSWNFNLGEQLYNSYSVAQNQAINIEYKISATGKQFINDSGKTLPAWEQAKNFAQDRLYTQVKGLISGILNRSNSDDGCSGNKTLNNIHAVSSPGSIDGISSNTHKVYNETVSCEFSEAEGTFSATYTALLKYNGGSFKDCIHTFTKNRVVSDDNKTHNVTISVQGSLTGLIPGGLINSPNVIELPRTGTLLLAQNNTSTKYSQALTAYGQVSQGRDLSGFMKDLLDITMEDLEVSGPCVGLDYPKPISFTTTHDYTNGMITYSAEYSSNKACTGNGDRSFRNISISIEDSVPIIAEFVIPGRTNGPIIQKIGANSPKRINVSIEGVVDPNCSIDIANELTSICSGGLALPNDIPSIDLGNNLKLTQNQASKNVIDGSYSINRSYILID